MDTKLSFFKIRLGKYSSPVTPNLFYSVISNEFLIKVNFYRFLIWNCVEWKGNYGNLYIYETLSSERM